jgi:fatty acid desaturase
MEISETKLISVPELSCLTDRNGVNYKQIRKSFSIRYNILIFNMLLPWVLIAIMIQFFKLLSANIVASYLILIPATFWISFWKVAYTLHLHEAAHFNIHKNKSLNDFLSNIFLTPFVGMWVKNYRVVHWQHHEKLGFPDDTEVSYHKEINLSEIFQALTGVYLFKTFLRYFNNAGIKNGRENILSAKISFLTGIMVMLITQTVITFIIYNFASVYAAASWVLSIFITEPFLLKIRQTLEHRSLFAKKDTDYKEVVHGAVNRIFGNDLFSSYFGGAGFNRHLLHHLDLVVSYTDFDKFESFLMNSEARSYIEENRATYLKTFKQLFK